MSKSAVHRLTIKKVFPGASKMPQMDCLSRRRFVLSLLRGYPENTGGLSAMENELQRLLKIKNDQNRHPDQFIEQLSYPDLTLRNPGESRGSSMNSPVERVCRQYPDIMLDTLRELDREIAHVQARRTLLYARKHWIDAMLAALTARERFVVEQHDLERVIWEEVEELYNKTMPTPRERRALMRLRNRALDRMTEFLMFMMKQEG